MASAVFVTPFVPSPVGHGGDHRAYQILRDLEHVVGGGNVVVVRWRQERRSPTAKAAQTSARSANPSPVRRIGRRIPPLRFAYRAWRRLRQRAPFLFAEHPIDPLGGAGAISRRYATPGFVDHYRQVVERVACPAICVIEHVSFIDVLPINSRLGIQTVACIQNVESFDKAVPLSGKPKRYLYLAALDFADECQALARCDARLFISRVEAGLVGGLGLPSYYYPYLPVGEIRSSLERIRRERTKEAIKPGLFLMLGSAGHGTTRESFSWFIQNAQERGLPEGVHVVVGGSKTNRLLTSEVSVPGLELRGWLEQDELDELLVRAQAVLAPQTLGFGAMTRLSELSCAGIPVIVSRHPTYAIDPLPGLEIVVDDWDAWCGGMKKIANGAICADLDAYRAWERMQPNPMKEIAARFLAGQT